PLRAPLPGPPGRGAQRLQHARALHALRGGEEERHPADRLHEHAARPRHAARRGDPRGEPRAPPSHPDDDRHARLRHGADRARAGPRLGLARLDRTGHHRRAGALAAHHPPHHAGRVLAVRRPGSVAAGAAPVASGAAPQLTDGPSAGERRTRLSPPRTAAGRAGRAAALATASPWSRPSHSRTRSSRTTPPGATAATPRSPPRATTSTATARVASPVPATRAPPTHSSASCGTTAGRPSPAPCFPGVPRSMPERMSDARRLTSAAYPDRRGRP